MKLSLSKKLILALLFFNLSAHAHEDEGVIVPLKVSAIMVQYSVKDVNGNVLASSGLVTRTLGDGAKDRFEFGSYLSLISEKFSWSIDTDIADNEIEISISDRNLKLKSNEGDFFPSIFDTIILWDGYRTYKVATINGGVLELSISPHKNRPSLKDSSSSER